MKLALRSQGIFTLDEMKSRITELSMPALLADSSLKIRAKGGCFTENAPHFRIGTRLDRLFSERDCQRLTSLDEGETFIAELAHGAPFGYATVIKGENCFLVCFRRFADGFYESIIDRCSRLSGYDVGLMSFLSEALTEVCFSRGGSAVATAAEKLLNELSEVHKLPFFDFSSALTKLICAIGDASPSAAGNIAFPKAMPEAVAVGSGNDFLLLAAFLLALCLGDSHNRGIEVTASEQDGEICVTVGRATEHCDGFAESLSLALEKRNRVDRELDEASVWAFFIKLIADCNLWEISSKSNGKLVEFVLKLPSVARGEEFYVREIDLDGLPALLRELFK